MKNSQLAASFFGLFLMVHPLLVSGQGTTEKGEQEKGKAAAKQETSGQEFSVADKGLVMTAPAKWKKVEPKVNMIEAEFSIPKQGDDATDGRMTIMGAGGSVQQNIDRWMEQFVQPDGKATSDVAKVEKKTVNELTVHVVDITGNFMDSMGGPFGPKSEKENYRMLAAIVETESHGNYFIKFYGPKNTISENQKEFLGLVESIREIN
jgi:hypothetical protein